MASPFPGMDPYLERYWGDVHASFIIYARDQLNSHLPKDLRARVEERVFVESATGLERSMYPDIRVVERGKQTPPPVTNGVAVAEPLLIQLDEQVTQTFIEILDASTGKRVITVIEVLSLSNKLPGEGQDKYLQKQRELREARVSLVEIDLLRAGRRPPTVPLERLPPSKRTAYQAYVRRGWQPTTLEVYPIPLRERLPAIRIPLRETDADVPLDLQAIIEQCYRNSGYDEDIDYMVEPDPLLDPEDAAWTAELLRSQRRR